MPPDAANLQRIVRMAGLPAWKVDRASGSAARLPGGPIVVDSLGKGYIISKAALAARAKVPAARGILINIGGDIYASGESLGGGPWGIGVADPKHSADNAKPLTQLRLKDRAVSTSAAYERGYTVGGRHLSHILDPRTGYPAAGVASATVIAANNANANALATTLCVLKPEEGIAFVRQIPDVDCLIVAADGRELRTPHFAAYEQPAAPATEPPASPAKPRPANAWPAGYEVAMTLVLKQPDAGGRGPKRPYVAVWVEDEKGERVRTVTVWGNKRKYFPELSAWWKLAKQDEGWAQTVTRATRPAGKYTINWDGQDDKGTPVPRGTYTIVLEVNREHGTRSMEKGTIACGQSAAKGTIPASTEFDAAELSFGPSVAR